MERLKEWKISKRQLGLIFYGNERIYESEKRWKSDEKKIILFLDGMEFTKKLLDL